MARARRASLPVGSHLRDPLSDEDASARRHRDGIARAGLQFHPRHEYHRRPTARGGNEDIAVARGMRPRRRA
jgi:hypothetical protein